MERINVKTINRNDIYNITISNTLEDDAQGVIQCGITDVIVKNETPYTHWMSDNQYLIRVYMIVVVEPSNLVNRIFDYSNNPNNKRFYIKSDAAGLNPTIEFDRHNYPITSFTRVKGLLMSPESEVMDRSLVAHPRVQQIQDECLGKYCPSVNQFVGEKLYDRYTRQRHSHIEGGTKKNRRRKRSRRKFKK